MKISIALLLFLVQSYAVGQTIFPPQAQKQQPLSAAETVLNASVLSHGHSYPLHVRVLTSGVSFVSDNSITATSQCWHLFGTWVCATQASGPQTYGIAQMRVKIEETGEETDVECGGGRLSDKYCKALPVGLYAARFYSIPMNRQRVALIVPALPLEGKHKDKEVAAYFTKDLHHPYVFLPEFDAMPK